MRVWEQWVIIMVDLCLDRSLFRLHVPPVTCSLLLSGSTWFLQLLYLHSYYTCTLPHVRAVSVESTVCWLRLLVTTCQSVMLTRSKEGGGEFPI